MRSDIAWVDLQQVLQITYTLDHVTPFEVALGPRFANVVSCTRNHNSYASLRNARLPVPLRGSLSSQYSCALRLFELSNLFCFPSRFIVFTCRSPVGFPAPYLRPLHQRSLKSRL